MFENGIIDDDLLDEIEKAEIDMEESSLIITNPYGAITLPYDGR